MTPTNQTILNARVKSFLWRTGGMIVVGIIGFIAQNLGLFNLNPQLIVVIGLVLNEITKHISDQLALGRKI